MGRCCRNCMHWQGRRNTQFADCYMVIAELIPNFLSCFTDLGYEFTVPFDPHDVKYYLNSLTFKKLYRKLTHLPLSDMFKKDHTKEFDFVFDSLGRLHLKRIPLLFLQTKREYKCEYFKEKEVQHVWKKENTTR